MAAEQQVELVDASKAAEWLRDSVLEVIRREQVKPWKTMNESEQEWVAARVEAVAKGAVAKVCDIIAGSGILAIGATMGRLGTDKDGCAESKITFKPDLNDEEKIAIWDHINGKCVVVLMDPTEYSKIERKAVIMKDQPALPLADDGETTPVKIHTSTCSSRVAATAGQCDCDGVPIQAAQQPGQPNWPVVADAIAVTGTATRIKRADAPIGDAQDAADPMEDDEPEAAPPRDSLVDPDDEDDISATDTPKIATLQDPTKKTAATAKKKA